MGWGSWVGCDWVFGCLSLVVLFLWCKMGMFSLGEGKGAWRIGFLLGVEKDWEELGRRVRRGGWPYVHEFFHLSLFHSALELSLFLCV